jgi:hypothetical protein
MKWPYWNGNLMQWQLLKVTVRQNINFSQFNSIQFIQWSQRHAQQSPLNVCNTAILGYHGDKIILYKKHQKYKMSQITGS